MTFSLDKFTEPSTQPCRRNGNCSQNGALFSNLQTTTPINGNDQKWSQFCGLEYYVTTGRLHYSTV